MEGSNAKKWDDHQKEKFVINNSIEALIPFIEKHQGLLKLHVLFKGRREVGWCSSVGKKWGYI